MNLAAAAIIVLLFLFYLRIRFFRMKIGFTDRGNASGSGAGSAVLARPPVELNGIIHFHSLYSDGSGRIEDIIETAKKLGADFLVSSDHNTLKPKTDGMEGYYGRLLYFAGEEINTEFGHLLAVGINGEIKRGNYADVLSAVKAQDGTAVLCHPHNWWTPWKNFDVEGYDGIEIINLDSQWRGMNPLYILVVMLSYRINPFYALHFLSHKPVKTIKFWDGVQRRGSMKSGIASIDAHSNVKLTKKIRIKFPKYAELFSVARTHILLENKLSGNLEKDRKSVAEALKKGRCYFSFDLFGTPAGFYFNVLYAGRYYSSGDSVRLGRKRNGDKNLDNKGGNAIIYAGIGINRKKNKFVINLFRNGEKVFSSKNGDLTYEIGAAADAGEFYASPSSFYRIEIDVYFGIKKVTYLYSNNIEVYS